MRVRSVWVAVPVALLLANEAHAGPVEQVAQVGLHPSKPEVMVLRYIDGGGGLFYSDDGGESWALMCLDAMDANIRNTGPIAVGTDGTTLMGVYEGLFQDDGRGCGWTRSVDVWVSDIARHPLDPDVLFLSTSMGGEGVLNGMKRRDADGKLSDFGPREELLISRLRIVQNGDGIRIYQSVLDGTVKVTIDDMEYDAPNYMIRYSDDEGETFTAFPFSAPKGSLRLQAVDPGNPDRVIAVLDKEGEDDELLVSNDRGETFETYMTLSQFGALEFTPDGKVFIGEAGFSVMPSKRRALWVADNLDSEPTMLADYPVQCLAYQPTTDTLFACQYRQLGTVDRDTGEFSEVFSFKNVEEFVECSGADTMDMCEAQLCADYCTFGHFASAELCNGYTGPTCGPCVAALERGEETGPECALTGGGAGAAGARGAAGANGGASGAGGSSSNMGSAGAGNEQPGGGTGTEADDPDDGGGGCNCSNAGQRGSVAGLGGFLATLALGLLLRRRGHRLLRTRPPG